MSNKMENALKEFTQELSQNRKLDWFPLKMYDILEESLPHGLVVQLGEIIIKNKGYCKP